MIRLILKYYVWDQVIGSLFSDLPVSGNKPILSFYTEQLELIMSELVKNAQRLKFYSGIKFT